MAISEFSAGPPRKRIGFVRNAPSVKARNAFKQRGYTCYLLDDAALNVPGTLNTTDSVIISQQPGKPSHFIRDLRSFSNVLNYDCRLYIRYAPDTDSQSLVLDALSSEQLPPSGFSNAEVGRFSTSWFDASLPIFAPFVHILTADDDWHQLANLIANNPAGRPPNASLRIDPQAVLDRGTDLADERELLLKRAFWDCSLIELFPKTDGMSGVDAFDVFAHLARNVVGGPAPYRCFVKLGPRVKVAREFERYGTTALEYVPFHLGPRLRADRCVLGRSQGLITCDYVVGAETLRDCIRDGRGVHVIGNLFNQTLISWRRAAIPEPRPLQEYLSDHLRERGIIPGHREPLIKSYGAVKSSRRIERT